MDLRIFYGIVSMVELIMSLHFQVTAWYRTDENLLFEPMMARFTDAYIIKF